MTAISCSKRAYPTAKAARRALHRIQRKRTTHHKEQRYYRCPDCRRFHLTSMEPL